MTTDQDRPSPAAPWRWLARIFMALALLLAAQGCLATSGPPIDRAQSPRRALLVLDMQRDFLATDARLPIAPAQVAKLLDTTNALIVQAEAADVEVIYIANAFSPDDFFGNLFRHQAAVAGSPGAELDERLVRRGPLLTKDVGDAFSNDELDALLREKRVGHVFVVGVFADQCVNATARGALNRNYAVTVFPEALGAASNDDLADALDEFRAAGVQVLEPGAWTRTFSEAPPPHRAAI